MDLKSQTPAMGVVKINEHGISKMYQVVCNCTSPDCTHTVDIEATDNGVWVTVYAKVKLGLFNNRWKHIWSLLTKGYAEFETDMLLNRQTAINYADMIKSAVNDVEEFRMRKKHE
jgi:hypothetical protein